MRVLKYPELAAAAAAQPDPSDELIAWVGGCDPASLAKRRKRRAVSAYERSKKRALDILDGERRATALAALRPGMLVGLYAILHEKIYGVEPLELRQEADWKSAAAAAARVLTDLGPLHSVDFIRWVMAGQLARRKRGVVSDFRVTWRWLFLSLAVRTDYRVHLAKTAKIS